MAVETEFGLSIPDEDAARIITVGHFYQYILRRACLAPPPSIEPIRPTEDPVPPEILTAIGLPRSFHRPTAERVSQSLAALHYHELLPPEAALYGAIWHRLVKIVVEQLGVDPCYVTMEAEFVKDLGAD